MTDLFVRSLDAARQTPARPPSFEAVAEASTAERRVRLDDDAAARRRARRWLWVGAFVWWLVCPAAILVETGPLPARDMAWWTVELVVASTPSALLLLWAARMTRSTRFRHAVLVRGIATSNLVLALCFAFADFYPLIALLSALLAIASGGALYSLGLRDLDGSGDDESEFTPARFRGVLILALVLACADAMTLFFTAGCIFIPLSFSPLWNPTPEVGEFILPLALLTGAGVVMVVNAWGLSRLRTWALVTGVLANIAIAWMICREMLWTGPTISVALIATAGLQVLLPLPIVAAALGRDWRWAAPNLGIVLVRWVVPLLVATTVIAAIL